MIRFITSISLIFAFSFLNAQEKMTPVQNMEEVTNLLINASKRVESIHSSFVQEKHLEYLSSTIESSGSFWFKKENQLRWEYKDPFTYIIVAANGKFTIKDEEKTSVFDVNSNKAFKELNDILINTVNGNLIHSDKFGIEIWEGKQHYLVRLDPNNAEMKKVLNKIELYFLKTDLTVSKVKMIEASDDYTIISFSDKKINTAIEDSIFKL